MKITNVTVIPPRCVGRASSAQRVQALAALEASPTKAIEIELATLRDVKTLYQVLVQYRTRTRRSHLSIARRGLKIYLAILPTSDIEKETP